MNHYFKLTTSLEKVMLDSNFDFPELKNSSMLKNDIFSFQLATKFESPNEGIHEYVTIEVESPIKEYIRVFRQGYVPVTTPRGIGMCDDDYLFTSPTVAPDPLFEIYDGKAEIFNGQTRSFWFTIEPSGKVCGVFPVRIIIKNDKEEIVGDTKFEIEIIDCLLPEQKLINSCWFHGDCISTHHNAEVFSDKYWELTDKYMAIYRKFGHNMILTPVVTPPLDTQIGGERPTNQLVEVYFDNGVYSFDFQKLSKWIELAKKNDIHNFEIAHLFTQWGAKFTPKVMAHVNGEYKKIFGWEVESLSDEYKAFLKAFLPALIAELKKHGVYENSYFHVSDEPMPEHKQQYLAAKELIIEFVPESQLIDALASFEFYEEGIVKHPIVSNDHINKFLDAEVEGLRTYYCVCQGDKVANRFMAMPSYRNRVLGIQLYKNNIIGFLQWGFNFWYSKLSKFAIDPFMTNDSSGFISGDAFVVYPVDSKDNVVVSSRLYVFNEALQDVRALDLLESLTNRDYVLGLLEDFYRFTDYPRCNDYYINLRETINREISKHI